MQRPQLFLCLIFFALSSAAQPHPGSRLQAARSTMASSNAGATVQDDDAWSKPIRTLLNAQVECWNQADIDGFMQTYWKSPDLTFSSGGQTTRGWQATCDRYKQKYDTPEKMGKLSFKGLEFHRLSENSAYALGRWHLQRADDELEGNFSLVLKHFEDGWKIVHDHSSLEPQENE